MIVIIFNYYRCKVQVTRSCQKTLCSKRYNIFFFHRNIAFENWVGVVCSWQFAYSRFLLNDVNKFKCQWHEINRLLLLMTWGPTYCYSKRYWNHFPLNSVCLWCEFTWCNVKVNQYFRTSDKHLSVYCNDSCEHDEIIHCTLFKYFRTALNIKIYSFNSLNCSDSSNFAF